MKHTSIKILCFFILFLTQLQAHKTPDVKIDLSLHDKNKLLVKAYYSRSKKPLIGHEVQIKLISSNQIIAKKKLSKKPLVFDIPNESYLVTVIVREDEITKKGFAPIEGFEKVVEVNEKAFFIMGSSSLFVILIAIILAIKNNIKMKKRKY